MVHKTYEIRDVINKLSYASYENHILTRAPNQFFFLSVFFTQQKNQYNLTIIIKFSEFQNNTEAL